jgi:putative RNA 2'-phosphotransferase
MKKLDTLSKFLALILRHEPQKFGLAMDEEGFTDADDVLLTVQTRFGSRYTWADIESVIAGDAHGKKRYELQDDKIRALYGHSLKNDTHIQYPPAVPPDALYHGTTQTILPLIQHHGLLRQQRQYVHLTTNLEIAKRVAQRHGSDTIILRIRALEAHSAGYQFFHPEAEHYLTHVVPPEFIDVV